MPGKKYRLRIDEWEEIHELPGSWPAEALRRVLEGAEFDEAVSAADLPEMVSMALQDLGDRKASELVLGVVFGDAMSSGVRQNVADDLQNDRPWEHYADVDKQAGLFEAIAPLQRAFPTHFGIPDALRLRLEVTATDAESGAWLGKAPSAPLLLRLLASGMAGDAVLRRLYESELASEEFPDATAILWQVREAKRSDGPDPRACLYDLYSSWQWFGPLEDRTPWEGVGWPDGER